MERITITKDMLLAARDYAPEEEKEAFLGVLANRCFDRLKISVPDKDADEYPPMYKVNTGLKARYLMGALLIFYLDAKFEEETDHLMTVAEYDRWAGSHVLNQIERWKADRDVKDKCFDLLEDYRALERRFSAEINALLAVQNDPVIRQRMDNQAAMAELPAVIREFQMLQEKREGDDRK